MTDNPSPSTEPTSPASGASATDAASGASPGDLDASRAAIRPDEVSGSGDAEGDQDGPTPSVTEPGKVMRIGSMVKQLLEEIRETPLDDASRDRLAEIYERSIVELSEALSPELQEELRTLALPFGDGVPTDAELRVSKAQLVGWLEGLFHGIQASLMVQQAAAQQQLQQMRQIGPQGHPGAQRPGQPGGAPGGDSAPNNGTYL